MKKNDFILAGIVLSAAFFLFLLQKSAHFSDGQGVVAVYREKEQIAVYPLQQDREEVFRSSSGGTNRLVIHDGEAWIEDADCPDGLCMKQGKISAQGEAVTCLPHRLTVVVEGGEKSGIDAVVR